MGNALTTLSSVVRPRFVSLAKLVSCWAGAGQVAGVLHLPHTGPHCRIKALIAAPGCAARAA